MNDRELLELAAKAAGYWLRSEREPDFDDGKVWISDQDIDGVKYWPSWRVFDPRIDYAEAMRLSMRLMIDVCHNHPADHQRWVLAERGGAEGCFPPACCVEDDFGESDRGIAACRAILRAAAEIGKAMK